LRNLERRFRKESATLRDVIERQRRSDRVRGSVIAANEGRLRTLEEKTNQRRRKIEAARSLSSQQEALLALLVDVVS
jgi:hypothetical protein